MRERLGPVSGALLVGWILFLAVALHAVYFFRNRTKWAREAADFVKEVAGREDDVIVLSIAMTADLVGIIVLTLYVLGFR